ncbi:MAG: hypothetical protein ACOYN8_05890 [Pseudanabaena sp.]|jgi:hypothetical protein
MTTPPIPEPQLDCAPITLDQYHEYTPEKLELLEGFYGYGGQDIKGFHLAMLTNMGLREAISHLPISKWLEVIQDVALQNPKLDNAMRDRLNRGIADLMAVAEFLEN